ncbi:MAG: orotidine-5'-phosphate decarboxylase [Cyanobacteria bacterium SIG30]|nr:orotidine-5'-phosphate decarboxylase [Cyanobacteria bacterium SIG30]
MAIKKPLNPRERIILALDVDDFNVAQDIVRELKDYVGFFKVGLQLYTSCGFDVVEMIQSNGGRVFFDGKFHDIPNTVARACANLVKRDIDFFDIHIKGGSKMLSTTVRLAQETAKKYEKEQPTILGVTLLSSFGQRTLNQELGVDLTIDDYVARLANLAQQANLNGVVASASEARKIREICGEDFLIVCPAVRPTWSVVDDQVRVVTPTDAIKAGVDYMIVGRPIINASDRVEACNMIIAEIENAIQDSLMNV